MLKAVLLFCWQKKSEVKYRYKVRVSFEISPASGSFFESTILMMVKSVNQKKNKKDLIFKEIQSYFGGAGVISSNTSRDTVTYKIQCLEQILNVILPHFGGGGVNTD